MLVLRKRRVLFVVPPLGGTVAPQAPSRVRDETTNNGGAAIFSEFSFGKRPHYCPAESSSAPKISQSFLFDPFNHGLHG